MNFFSNSPQDQKKMLEAVGTPSIEGLLGAIPKKLRDFKWRLPKGSSEIELDRLMTALGSRNRTFHAGICFLGAGVYDHYVPPAVNALACRSEFITAYTPYQGEASQGTLQSIYEYQSMICELTGMDYSNASMYDGSSALAEAAVLALRATGRKKILIPDSVDPDYRQVVRTYLSFFDARIIGIPLDKGGCSQKVFMKEIDESVAAVIIQQPNFYGIIEDVNALSEATRKKGALLISCVNPLSLGVLACPGEYGADIAVGDGQPLGNSASFGGPHFGFFAVQEAWLRKMPGRIVGKTTDKNGKTAFVLTLQAREQHIRREKATSNICTNHALCALKGSIYLALLGAEGLKKLALLNMENARNAYERLLKIKGVEPFSTKPFFNEFAITIRKDSAKLKESFDRHRLMGPLALGRLVKEFSMSYLVAVTEKRTPEDIDRLAKAIEEV